MKLDTDKVAEIKMELAAGVTQPALAEKYGVSRSLISDISTGRAWREVKIDVPTRVRGGRGITGYDPTDNRVLDLQAEVNLLREERGALQKQNRAMLKDHGIFQAIVEEIQDVVKPYDALPSALPVERGFVEEGQIEEDLVMHLSDGHHDQVVKPSECGGLENHTFPVSMRRAEHYVDTVLKWTQQTLAPQFYFPTLTILAYGDHTSGEIHGNTQRSYFRNAFKNSFAIGQLHALMIRDLAPYFETVNVLYVPGNHGRRSIKKDYHGAKDNWDYMVAEVARLHCRDIPNTNFIIPDTYTVNLDINGVGFSVFHGDDIKTSMGIPWYGLSRKQSRLSALAGIQKGTRVRYYACGHFHRPGTTSELDGELLINGTWIASDAYVYNSFSGYTEPTQIIHGVHEKYGVTWRLPVKLKTDGELKGPKRYKIDMMNQIGD